MLAIAFWCKHCEKDNQCPRRNSGEYIMIIFSAACLVFPFSFHSPRKIHQQLLQVPIAGDQWKHGHRTRSVAQCWIGVCVSLTLFSLLLGLKGTYSTYSRIKKRINPSLLCFTVFGIWNKEIMLNSVILIIHTQKNIKGQWSTCDTGAYSEWPTGQFGTVLGNSTILKFICRRQKFLVSSTSSKIIGI